MSVQGVQTTTFSLSRQPPAPLVERRDGERHRTVFRVGAIVIGGQRELCLIKNISEGGMMIRAYDELCTGTRVAVELKSGHMVAGIVAWTEGANIGIAFDKPVDVLDILSNAVDGPRPRLPRVETSCHVLVRDGGTVWRMRVRDISQGGLKVETATHLARGTDVTITLPGMEPQAGVVRWCEDGLAGLTFNQLMPLATLVDWLREQRKEMRSAS